MSEWQPIETAPKDGTEILVCLAGVKTSTGVARWAGGLYDWVGYDSNGDATAWPTASHWMPLPEPPKAPQQSVIHDSDCQMHNTPASEAGPCNCSARPPLREVKP